jgi:hypothetical protein
MPQLTPVNVTCSTCGQPVSGNIRTMIDVSEDPQAKAMLLSGRLNMLQCPNCNTMNTVAASLLYHDPEKELLIAHVPMELNLNKDQQEKIIGNMMNALPKTNFKGYMFSPRRALTMQNLTEQVLEADGITREMMDEQKNRVELIQQLVEAPEDALPGLVSENDEQIDDTFFQTMTMMAQRTAQDGRSDIAQQIIIVQNRIAELSTFGKTLLEEQEEQTKIVEEVAEAVRALGADADREAFFTLAHSYAEDEQRLQALVGLARPAFDYVFLQDLTVKIGQAPADERDRLTTLRDHIVEFTAAIDQQTEAAMQNAASFLQAVVNHPQPEALLRANIHMIDDTLMAVLQANLERAEQQQDVNTSAKLKTIYDTIVGLLQSQMQPELVFVNELLSAESESDASQLIQTRAKEFGEPLLEVMDAVSQVLAGQGNAEMQTRLKDLRDEVAAVLV